MEVVRRIYVLLLHSNGLKIKDIANELDIDKFYVADIMFSADNIPFWYQNSSSLWFAKEGAIEIKEPKEDKLTAPLITPKVIKLDRFFQGNISASLRSYLSKLSTYRVYADDEIIELLKRYRDGDKKALGLIIQSNQKLVIGLAILYCKYGIPLEDLIQEGNIGLMRAVERFDLSYHSFHAYAKGYILQAISSSMVFLPFMVRLPLNQWTLHRKIRQFKEKYEQQNGYLPSVNDIDIDEDVDFERIAFIDKLPDNLKEWTTLHEDMDVYESHSNSIEEKYENDDIQIRAWQLINRLPQREKLILQSYFGIRAKEESLFSIGERLNLTRERVRQILEKSIGKLRDVIESSKQESNDKPESNNIQRDVSTTDIDIPLIFEGLECYFFAKKPKKKADSKRSKIENLDKSKSNNSANYVADSYDEGLIGKANNKKINEENSIINIDEVNEGLKQLSTNTIYEVFNNTVSTYKFYWFISILQLLHKDKTNKLYVYDIVARMVANAWHLVTCHKLSFGSGDSLHGIVRELQKITLIPDDADIESVYKVLKKRKDEREIKRQLKIITRDVPYRFLAPWKNTPQDKPEYLYSLNMDCDIPYIKINPIWEAFLNDNYEDLVDFSKQKLSSFLNKRNTNNNEVRTRKIKAVKETKTEKFYNYTIKNKEFKCEIYDDRGNLVYYSLGKIKRTGSSFFRLQYSNSHFSINLLNKNRLGIFETGRRIISAKSHSQLFKKLSQKDFLNQIEDIRYHTLKGYCVIVNGVWYDGDGDVYNKRNKSDEKKNDIEKNSEPKEEHSNAFIDEVEIEHVYLDSHGNISDNNTNSIDVIPERDFAKENGEGVTPTELVKNTTEDSKKKNSEKIESSSFTVKIGDTLKLFPSQHIGKVIKLRIDRLGQRKIVVKTGDGQIVESYDNKYLYEKIKQQIDISPKKEKAKRKKNDANHVNLITNQKRTVPQSSPKEAFVGDRILYDSIPCTVIEKRIVQQSFRLIVKYDNGTLDNVANDWNRYSVIESGKKDPEKTNDYSPRPKPEKQVDVKTDNKGEAKIGDWIVRTSDNLIGKVVEIRKLGSGIERLILELKDGSLSGVYNNSSLYRIIKRG